METPRKFIIAKLSICKLGSSSVRIIRLFEFTIINQIYIALYSFAIINLRGVSTKLNKYIVFTMQTNKELINLKLEKMKLKSAKEVVRKEVESFQLENKIFAVLNWQMTNICTT